MTTLANSRIQSTGIFLVLDDSNTVLSFQEYDYKIEKWFSQYDGKPYENHIPWKRFQNASPLHPVMNDIVLFFEITQGLIDDGDEADARCPKCVMFVQKGIAGTRQISAMLADSDECQKARSVNSSTCNQARFWCKEMIKLISKLLIIMLSN